MAWDHLSVNKPHLVYIILGGFTSLFMLCSSVIKERLYIGEATVATLCGIIFGPHGADLINPVTWGNTDQITLEFSRIVLVVQCFAVGVELPKYYMEKHWRSVTLLLVPVMTFGWLMTSLFIWAMFHGHANWLDSLCIAACVTATDPVLASSVVGKGKFAKRVPKHLRDLLSAESGCNDGMAFPFIYLALYIIKYKGEPSQVALNWFCITILYECVFGAFYGVMIGYIARRLIRAAHERDYIDRESFLVFYFVLALFCAGSGSMLGVDDLLVGFACGVGFSNDGWFTEKTEEAHVSNVIDLLINLAFFVYFGTIIPWDQYNAGYLGLDVWRFVVIALLVIFFRRIPIMMAMKPIIPDIKTWREALFAGHFGPIGVGAIFVAILARAELETGETTPLAILPEAGFEHRNIIEMIWPITTFLVITSIVVHGSSIAVFTLGKHINTLTLTMSYSKAVDEPNWMDRLPRIASRSKGSMSMQRSDSEVDEKLPPGTLPVGAPGTFLRRQKEEDNPSRAQSRSSSANRSKRKNKEFGRGPGGPVSESAIKPRPRQPSYSPEDPYSRSDSDTLAMKSESPQDGEEGKQGFDATNDSASPGEIFEEGDQTVFENEQGKVLAVEDTPAGDEVQRVESEVREGRRLMHEDGANHSNDTPDENDATGVSAAKVSEGLKSVESKQQENQKSTKEKPAAAPERPGQRWREGMRKMSTMNMIPGRDATVPKVTKRPAAVEKSHGPARAYQFGNTIIVEDEDGEVIKKYDIPGPERKHPTAPGQKTTRQRIDRMGTMLGLGAKDGKAQAVAAGPSSSADPVAESAGKPQPTGKKDEDNDVRFTMSTGGRRMSKADFIEHIRHMDPKRRVQAVEDSNAPEPVKCEARQEAREQGALVRSETRLGAVPLVNDNTKADAETDTAALKQTTSNDSSRDLKLVDSSGQDVPCHDVSQELNYQMGSGTGESAVERRRREAQQPTTVDEEDSEDDGTDRVPPTARGGLARHETEDVPHYNVSQSLASYQMRSQEGETAAERRRRQALQRPASDDDSDDDGTERVPPTQQLDYFRTDRNLSDGAETAAEKRRREGALGIHEEEEESESEEEEEPRQLAPGQEVRFADQASSASVSQPRQSTLRWGKDIGR